MGQLKIKRFEAQSGELPPLCMMCAEKETHNLTSHEFSYYPSYAYIGCLLGLLPFLLIALLTQKKERVNLRLCEQCAKYFSYNTPFGCLVALGAILLLIFSMVMFDARQQVPGAFMIIGAISLPFVFYFKYNSKWSITCAGIDDQMVTLNLPNSRYQQIYADYKTRSSSVDCRECGKANIEGARYCEKCGATLSAW